MQSKIYFEQMSVPKNPEIYHIVHIDRIPSIINSGYLWCDAKVSQLTNSGTTIGMSKIKHRRLYDLQLNSHPDLHPGDCVPFYFCNRSIMLYLIHCGNHPDLDYHGGQEWIVHLKADLRSTVRWANSQNFRWAFTLSNAGSYFFEDRCELAKLTEIDWEAVFALDWSKCKDGKQAEFLIENQFPWELVTQIGVKSTMVYNKMTEILGNSLHKPKLDVRPSWYY